MLLPSTGAPVPPAAVARDRLAQRIETYVGHLNLVLRNSSRNVAHRDAGGGSHPRHQQRSFEHHRSNVSSAVPSAMPGWTVLT